MEDDYSRQDPKAGNVLIPWTHAIYWNRWR